MDFALKPEPPSVGTGSIKGKVVDVVTGKNLAGVLVKVTDTEPSATTSKNGRYFIEDVPGGSQEVTASKDGYSASARAVNVTSDETVTVDFDLTK